MTSERPPLEEPKARRSRFLGFWRNVTPNPYKAPKTDADVFGPSAKCEASENREEVSRTPDEGRARVRLKSILCCAVCTTIDDSIP